MVCNPGENDKLIWLHGARLIWHDLGWLGAGGSLEPPTYKGPARAGDGTGAGAGAVTGWAAEDAELAIFA
jgi:hypothetical protein